MGLRSCRGALYVRPCHKSNLIQERKLDRRVPIPYAERVFPTTARSFGAGSILRYRRIDLIRPGEDTACKVVDLAEAGFLKEVDSFGGALSAAAMGHDFA